MPPFHKETEALKAGVEYDPGDTANKQQGRTETGESGSAVPTLHHG